MARLALSLFLLFALSNCSFIFGPSPEERRPDRRELPRKDLKPIESPETDPVIQALTAAPTEETAAPQAPEVKPREFIEGIEVTWDPAPEPVDGYVIHFGTRREALDQKIKLQKGQIERSTDEEGKPFFRYIISPSDPTSTVYVAVASFVNEEESGLSEIREILPEDQVRKTAQ